MSLRIKLSLRFLRELLDSTKDLLSHLGKGGVLEIIRSPWYSLYCYYRPGFLAFPNQ